MIGKSVERQWLAQSVEGWAEAAVNFLGSCEQATSNERRNG